MVQVAYGTSGRCGARKGRHGLIAALLVLAAPALAQPKPAFRTPDDRCRAAATVAAFEPKLPLSRQALAETGRLTIVALGSSSTAGPGASGQHRSYPAVLQAELRRRLPGREITVLNRGASGQSAYEMLARMDVDVIDEKPGLVIWQTAVADAVRDIGEDKLARILGKGIRKLHDSGIELIMMDLLWLPRESRYPHYDDYRAVLAKTAAKNGVTVFPRYAMMNSWSRTRQFTSEELVGMDGLQVVDAGYRCLAIRLADGIAAALLPAGEGGAASPAQASPATAEPTPAPAPVSGQ
ncbi:GDSL-type esterase/lipase family protein [Bosea sp. TWI1241]|uniref:SGNH/GDSL hydrolase family protein n=1 Tax=Bosea sp. TWI1241 TaxID=3148904 RepID=UPI00320A055A